MKKNKTERKFNALLGTGNNINGTLEFNGTVRLDGKVTGNIVSTTGTVIIGEKASIEADIVVGMALISGEVVGTIKATEKIELYPSARITGDLVAKIIRIEAGARFIGNCSTFEKNNSLINSVRSESHEPLESRSYKQKKL